MYLGIGRRGTRVVHQHGGDVYYYWDTPIVTITVSGVCILRSGGWRTPTTKRRMNQISQVRNLGFRVYQRNWEWYVQRYKDGHVVVETTFTDGMELPRI